MNAITMTATENTNLTSVKLSKNVTAVVNEAISFVKMGLFVAVPVLLLSLNWVNV